MHSTKLFGGNEMPRRRRKKPLARVLIVSLLAPGVGHFLVGRRRTGVILLGAMFLIAVANATVTILQLPHAGWILGRAGLILMLFSIADATLLRAEANDGRDWGRLDRPRLAAAMDLIAYGVSPWRRGEKGLAGVAIVFGAVVHLFLGSQSLPLLILSELLMLGWGAWSWHHAKEEASLQHVRVKTDFEQMLTKDDRKEPGETPSRQRVPSDKTPAWVMPILAALVAVVSLGVLGAHSLVNTLGESMHIDRSRVMSMEPFFRNPSYGVALEMNAPGWTFLNPAENEIISARHVADGVRLKLSVQPRTPLFADDRTAALGAMAQAMMHGTLLSVTDEGPRTVGGQPGYYLRTEGRRGASPIVAEIWTTGKGWREYVLWIERDPRHEKFATEEVAFVLDHLSIENGRPELSETTTSSAR